MNFIKRFIEWVDDSLNPIVVKELRQALKGRFIISVLFLFLTLQLTAMGFFLMDADIQSNFSLGRQVFTALSGFLLGACILVIPAFAGYRFAGERAETDLDFFFITTISPGGIIRGKFFATLIITALIFSACMPFMTFTYFLRGIDIPTIFVFLIAGFIMSGLAIQITLFLGSVPSSMHLRLLLVPLAGSILISLMTGTMGWMEDFFRYGPGKSFFSRDFLVTAGISFYVLFLVFGFLHVLSVAFISPNTANRAFPVRLFVFFAWLSSGLLAGFLGWVDHSSLPMETWAGLFSGLFSISLFMVVSEREEIGPRVAAAIPQKSLWRIPAFLFFSGAAGGVCYAVTMVFLTDLVFICMPALSGGPGVKTMEMLEFSVGFALFMLNYAMLGTGFRKLFLSEWVSQESTWVVALVMLAAGCILSPMVGFMVFEAKGDSAYILNPFLILGDRHFRTQGLLVASIWAVGTVLMSFRWGFAQFRQFRPRESEILREPG